MGLDRPLLVTKEAKAGDSRVYVSGLDQITGTDTMYITNRHFSSTETNDGYFFMGTTAINHSAGYIDLVRPLTDTFPVGYELHTHKIVTPVQFTKRQINTQNQWQVVNFNSEVTDYDYFDIQKLGASLYMDITAYDNLYIDNLKLGFATKVRVLDDNKDTIYEGYDTEYDDTTVTDNLSPTAPNTISIRKDVEGNNVLDFLGAYDPAEEHIYTLQTLDFADNIVKEQEKAINMSSGIYGYSYVYCDEDFSCTSNSIDTKEQDKGKNIPLLLTLASGKSPRYVLVTVIDNNYNTVDTMFDLLDYQESELSLSIPQINPMNTVLDKDIKTVKTSFTDKINISANSLGSDNWRLTVKANDFVTETGEKLPNRMYLQGGIAVEDETGTQTSQNTNSLLDISQEQTITDSTDTIGNVSITFPNNALVDILTSLDKIENNKSYNSTVEFTLISAP